KLNKSPVDGGSGKEVEAAPLRTKEGKRFAAEQKSAGNEEAVDGGWTKHRNRLTGSAESK
ncbi:hypothetical protein, partial [Hyalangium gracile]|uniref:hypothetical protein n=1 Tax=Hyalangium gracile TaxID=394092 RepID=UPI001CCC09E9